jgi:hypothetical protein
VIANLSPKERNSRSLALMSALSIAEASAAYEAGRVSDLSMFASGASNESSSG